MDFIKRLLAIFIQAAGQSVQDEMRSSKRRKRSSSSRSAGTQAHSPKARTASGKENKVWDVRTLGLPPFQYAPNPDGDADPGEVVWTWVSYEDDPSQGKDRPVVVLARVPEGLVVAIGSPSAPALGIRKDVPVRCAWIACLSSTLRMFAARVQPSITRPITPCAMPCARTGMPKFSPHNTARTNHD